MDHSSVKPSSAPTLPTSVLLRSKESLSPLISILQAFSHRHRNQHSSSHWWTTLSLLRRSLRNLSHALSQARPSTSKTKNRAKVRDKGDNHCDRQYGAVTHAKWLRNHVVPRAYIAFTQLAADNQHAPLGLLILSVLARTYHLVLELAPEDSIPKSPAHTFVNPLPVNVDITFHHMSIPTDFSTTVADADKGVAVPRNKIDPWQNKPASVPGDGSQKLRKTKFKSIESSKDESNSQNPKMAQTKPKKKKKGGDAFSSLFDSL